MEGRRLEVAMGLSPGSEPRESDGSGSAVSGVNVKVDAVNDDSGDTAVPASARRGIKAARTAASIRALSQNQYQ